MSEVRRQVAVVGGAARGHQATAGHKSNKDGDSKRRGSFNTLFWGDRNRCGRVAVAHPFINLQSVPGRQHVRWGRG